MREKERERLVAEATLEAHCYAEKEALQEANTDQEEEEPVIAEDEDEEGAPVPDMETFLERLPSTQPKPADPEALPEWEDIEKASKLPHPSVRVSVMGASTT